MRMDLREIGWQSVDQVHLHQDRDQWRAIVNTVMMLKSSIKCGKLLTS
jgi:hypothetical protein